MATNLIQNPNFNSGLNSWSTYGWHPGNTITALSSGGQNGACVKLVVPSEGDPGQSWIAQTLQLESGKDYTLSFYAKRTGNVDVWFQITMAGETEYSQSYRSEILSGGDYTSISYDFTAADTVDDTVSVNFRFIAGSAGGTVWFDTICLEAVDDSSGDTGGDGESSGTPTAGVITGDYVNVRAEPNTSADVKATVNTGDKVTYYAGETHEGSGYSWYRCTSTMWENDGFIATQYVEADAYRIQATVDTSKHGNGGTVNLRSKPYQSGSRKTTIGNGKTIYVKNMTGTWLPAKYGSYEGYVMAKFVKNSVAYNMSGNETSREGDGGVFYVGNRNLNSNEQENNAQYILDAFLERGWTKNAICGMLGNMQRESTINPGIWQSRVENNDNSGFGLTQWTPATKYFDWACAQGYLYDDIDAQIERILYEVQNPGVQWIKPAAHDYIGFEEYTHSTMSAAELATVFCDGYERSSSPNYSERSANATYWYEHLT